MDQERYADWLIERALEDGTLDASATHGKPLPVMNRDPLWWVRGLLEREAMPERYQQVTELVDALLEMAVKQPDLATSRELLTSRNEAATAWNAKAPDQFQLEVIEETELLTKRAEAPGG